MPHPSSIAAVRVRSEAGEFAAEYLDLDQPGLITAVGRWVRFTGPYSELDYGRRLRVTWPSRKVESIIWFEIDVQPMVAR